MTAERVGWQNLSVETDKETGMRTIEPEELKTILEKHKLWLDGQAGGERADLSSANLRSANLSSADLRSANLSLANLS